MSIKMMQLGGERNDSLISDADSYSDWLQDAQAYDFENGLERWKGIDATETYDYVLIRRLLDRLRKMRADKNNHGLLFALNEGIHGNLGGMGNEALYTKAKSGTKTLVEDYINEVTDALKYLASDEVSDIEFGTKFDFFDRAQQCFGHSALMLSGSGSLLYFHIGVVLALAEQDLIPRVISGSSGGAFIGSILCTHSNDELEEVFALSNWVDEDLLAQKEMQAQQKKKGLFPYNFKPAASVADFHAALERLIPDMTFQEALDKTGRHLNISVAAADSPKQSRLLNAKTSPNVYLRESVRASSAAPGLFPPTTLAAKNEQGERQPYIPSQQWVDGSLSSDLPAKRLARLYGVNHFVVSQTNPHVIPFVTDAKRKRDTMSLLKYASFDTARTWINTGAALWRKPMSSNERLTRLTATMLSIINQNYKGDINIIPPKQFSNPVKQFGWKDREEMAELIDAGRRATWPKIEMIRLQSQISRTLESIMNDLHDQVVQHQPQGDQPGR